MFNLKQTIKKCAKEDRKAQKQLYDRYVALMLGICMRYCKSRDEAEDVVQDGFLKIFTHIGSYQGTGSFEGWMKRIMINTALSNYKSNLKHYYHQDIDEANESDFTNNDIYKEPQFTREELLDAIHQLPDGYRMVFNLYAIEGYKHKEIAELLGIDAGTSKSQYSRAKKLIQKKLEQLDQECTPKPIYNEQGAA